MFSAALAKAFQVYGIAIAISMIVALLIKLLVTVTGRVAVRSAAGASDKAPAPQEMPAADETSGRVSDETVAVIAAVVTAAIGAHRILNISPNEGSWSKAGRADQHHHKPHY